VNDGEVPILGWDVGGANIKVARTDDGRCAGVVERAFPMWRERNRLPFVLAELADHFGRTPVMGVTMTAELADCFATKREGVAYVIDAFERAFPASAMWIYGVDGRFRSPEEARLRPVDVAAANWMASASLIARAYPSSLFVDVGSTTSDIVPIVAGRVAAAGFTDVARLQSGELVYTGCLRTPVCAIVRSVPLGTGGCRVAAEYFAIAADAYRWLCRITDEDYTCDTPDGRGRSRAEAGARLARMVCVDFDIAAESDVTAIADRVMRTQIRDIAHGIQQVLRRLRSTRPQVAIVAGSGAFLGRAAAEANDLQVRELASDLGTDAARAAPAAAVAHLLAERLCASVP